MGEYTREILLASQGKFYDPPLPDGLVELEPWGTTEEKLIAGAAGVKDNLLDKLIERGTPALPIPHDQLIIQDKFQILINLRVISYGSVYRFTYKCEDCGQKVGATIDLETDLTLKQVTEQQTEPYTCLLPIKKLKLGLKYLRGTDERAIRAYVKQLYAKQLVKPEDGDPEYEYRMIRHIQTINDKPATLQEAQALFPLLGPDSLAFRQATDDMHFGIDLKVHVKCERPDCGWENEINLPFGREFLRPSREHTRYRHTEPEHRAQ